ncbi:MAG: DapH/DapD/GlmU-related protein [Thermomicrobiales bacterium]
MARFANLSPIARRGYHPGRSLPVRVLWLGTEALTLINPLLLSSGIKVALLRRFGSELDAGALIKPGVHVKHPWRLKVGKGFRLGERAWIDNLVQVTIGDNVRISQGAYLCTGNHDWSDPAMGMTPKPIVIEDGAWVGAFAKIGPGVTVGKEAIVTMGSVLLTDAEPRGIYQGNPAVRVRTRTIRDQPGPATGAGVGK